MCYLRRTRALIEPRRLFLESLQFGWVARVFFGSFFWLARILSFLFCIFRIFAFVSILVYLSLENLICASGNAELCCWWMMFWLHGSVGGCGAGAHSGKGTTLKIFNTRQILKINNKKIKKEGSVGTCWAGALPIGLNRTQSLQHQTNMFRQLIASEVSDGKQSL